MSSERGRVSVIGVMASLSQKKKDIILLGASVWSLGESLRQVQVQPQLERA